MKKQLKFLLIMSIKAWGGAKCLSGNVRYECKVFFRTTPLNLLNSANLFLFFCKSARGGGISIYLQSIFIFKQILSVFLLISLFHSLITFLAFEEKLLKNSRETIQNFPQC